MERWSRLDRTILGNACVIAKSPSRHDVLSAEICSERAAECRAKATAEEAAERRDLYAALAEAWTAMAISLKSLGG